MRRSACCSWRVMPSLGKGSNVRVCRRGNHGVASLPAPIHDASTGEDALYFLLSQMAVRIDWLGQPFDTACWWEQRARDKSRAAREPVNRPEGGDDLNPSVVVASPFFGKQSKTWSGRRVSNSRPQPWQGCALPTELLPQEAAKYSETRHTFTAVRSDAAMRASDRSASNTRSAPRQHRSAAYRSDAGQ